MAIRIGADSLRETINSLLDEYGTEANEAITAASKEVARDVVKDLKKGGSYNGGADFNKGWTSTTELSRLGTSTVVHNKTKPGLAHLLEFGHAKRNGGRTKAFNFIAPVEATVGERFEAAFEKAMR